MTAFPTQARVVVIGGGIVGCSVVYHLCKLGWTDVVLLERAKLTSGSTFHAAGLVGQLRSSASITRLLKNSVELYAEIEAETGQATGWKMNGGLRLACNRERMTELRRQATTAHSFGLEMHLLTPKEAGKMWPLMETRDLEGAAFLPSDGQINPTDITQALVRGARDLGARVIEDCPVTAIGVTDARVVSVSTAEGDMACEAVVNCAGQWAAEVGRLAGVVVPVTSVQHQYMVSEPMDNVTPDLPTLRDPDRLIYFKEDAGRLVMGGYETNPKPWATDGIPEGFHFTLLESDWDHFEPLIIEALIRVPGLESVGVRDLINGPEAFTPDGNFILGEAPGVRGFFVGTGFNAFGIAAAGGAGGALAEWIVGGEAPMDLWPVDIRRFGAHHGDADWVRARTLELYAKHYSVSWPFEEHESGRPLRTSALYAKLKDRGACFGEKMGWERPNWFAPPGEKAVDEYSYGRQNWFEQVGREHEAARSSVALFDQSSFSKFMLEGKDVEAALGLIAANDVAVPVGRLVYTQMLNSRGCIECDLTVARVAEDAYYIVTGTGFRTHDFAWIAGNIGADLDATLTDVTDANGVLSLMGPAARDVLARATKADVSKAAMPFGACCDIELAGAPVRALRITYVGELGWELHFPIEHAAAVYDALMAAGAKFDIADAGYRAIESLRLEKGYRAWGADIGPDDTPLEAGLGWAVKDGMPFIGSEAIAAQARGPLPKRLACFTVDDADVVLLGRETIYRDGQRAGWLSSGGWGYTVAKNIGRGYVRNKTGVDEDYLERGTYELEVASERVPASLHLRPLYDPKGERPRG
jgi:4-methylaminobutanoate oxidase (formaldehyde-forming)